MVVARSPVQRVASTSPLILPVDAPREADVPNDDDDDLLSQRAGLRDAATPVKIPAVGRPVNDRLQQRINESLATVAASPSSKTNAPAPFTASSKLRRSPPGGSVPLISVLGSAIQLDHDKQASQDGDPKSPEAAHSASPVRDLPLEPGTVDSQSAGRSFNVAAKALFDGRESALVEDQRFPPPDAPADTARAQPKVALHRSRASLPDASLLRSAPMVQSTSHSSQLSVQSTPSRLQGPRGSPATPVSSLAKIGRLNARIGVLESQLDASKSEAEAQLLKYHALVEKCEGTEAEHTATLDKLQKYETIAEECERVLEDFDTLRVENQDLQERQVSAEAQLLKLRQDLGNAKLLQKKLRNELGIRRAESKWRDLVEGNKRKREHGIQLCALRVENIELERAFNTERADKEYYRGLVKLLETEAQSSSQAMLSVKQRTRSAESRAVHAEDKLRRTSSLLQIAEAKLEDLQIQLREKTVQVEEAEASQTSSQATSSKLSALQKKVTSLEKQVAKITEERDSLMDQEADLKNELSVQRAELKGKSKRIDSLEREVAFEQEERRREAEADTLPVPASGSRNLRQDTSDEEDEADRQMKERAKKAFGQAKKWDQENNLADALEPEHKRAKGKGKAISASQDAPGTRAAGNADSAMQSDSAGSGLDDSIVLPPPLASQTANNDMRQPSRATNKKQSGAVQPTSPRSAGRKKKSQAVPPPASGDEEAFSDSDDVVISSAARPVVRESKDSKESRISKKKIKPANRARKSTGRPLPPTTAHSSSGKRKEREQLSSEAEASEEEVEVTRKAKKTKTAGSLAGTSSEKTKVKTSRIVAKERVETKGSASAAASAGAGEEPKRKKTALNTGAKSAFSWGGGAPSIGGTSKSILQDLPDILSPVKRF